jgi:hypothetical protein
VNNTVHDTKPQVRWPQDRRAKNKRGGLRAEPAVVRDPGTWPASSWPGRGCSLPLGTSAVGNRSDCGGRSSPSSAGLPAGVGACGSGSPSAGSWPPKSPPQSTGGRLSLGADPARKPSRPGKEGPQGPGNFAVHRDSPSAKRDRMLEISPVRYLRLPPQGHEGSRLTPPSKISEQVSIAIYATFVAI